MKSRSDRVADAEAFIRENIALFRQREPNIRHLAEIITRPSEDEANKWFRKYHELKDAITQTLKENRDG